MTPDLRAPLPRGTKLMISRNPDMEDVIKALITSPKDRLSTPDIRNLTNLTSARISGALRNLKSKGIVDNKIEYPGHYATWYVIPALKNNLSIFIQSAEIEG